MFARGNDNHSAYDHKQDIVERDNDFRETANDGNNMYIRNVSTTTLLPPADPTWWNPDDIRQDIGRPGLNGQPPGLPSGPHSERGPQGTDHSFVNWVDKEPEVLPPDESELENFQDGRGSVPDADSLQSSITYIIVALAVGTIIASIIAFVFIKRRRYKNAGSSKKDTTDGTADTGISFYNEEELIGIPHAPIDAKDASILGKMNPSFIIPPKLERGDICKIRVSDYKVGTIPIRKEGGIFQHPHQKIYTSIPTSIVSSCQEIAIINSPLQKIPKGIGKENVLSDIITLLPHDTMLSEHVLICFPINMTRVKDVTKLQLLYSNTTNTKDEFHWINLQQNGTPNKHKDSIVWFVSGGYCFLYANHFCHVFVTQYCSLVEQPALFLQASIHGVYDEIQKKLLFRVGFHCSKCNPSLLSEKDEWGVLLWSGFRCIYGKEGDVTISMKIEDQNWKGPSLKKETDIDDLLNLCNLSDIFPPHTFTFKYQKKDEPDNDFMFQMSLSQGKKKPIMLDVVETLDNMIVKKTTSTDSVVFERSQSDPVEHTDNSLEPVENHDDSQDDIITYDNDGICRSCSESSEEHDESTVILPSHIFHNDSCEKTLEFKSWQRNGGPEEHHDQCTSDNITEKIKQELPSENDLEIVQYEKKGDCLFCEEIKQDETALCRMLEPSNKIQFQPPLLKSLCESKTTIDSKNLSGKMILQLWGLKVKMNTTTWEKIHKMLVDVNLNNIATQLNISVDKSNLIQAIDRLKLNLKPEPILTELLSRGIITNGEACKMRLIISSSGSNQLGSDRNWVQYLVHKVLLKQPVSTLYLFYDALQKMGDYNHLLQPLRVIQR